MTAAKAAGAAGSGQRPVVFVGTGALAQLMHESFVEDGGRDVVAFAVERAYLREPELLGKPVVALDEIAQRYPPATHDAFIAIGASQGHRLKRRLFEQVKAMGYRLASHVSRAAIVARTASIGENAFIGEFALVQSFARIGVGFHLWPGSYIGHHAVIGDFCTISGQVIVGGESTIGDHGFVGIHATIIDKIEVAKDCLVGAGAVVTRSTQPDQVLAGNPATPKPYTFTEYYKR